MTSVRLVEDVKLLAETYVPLNELVLGAIYLPLQPLNEDQNQYKSRRWNKARVVDSLVRTWLHGSEWSNRMV